MIRGYTVAPSARVDLDEIWHYIARKASVEVAESVVEAITGIFPLLAANPAMGRHRPNMSNMPLATRGSSSNSAVPECIRFMNQES